MSTITDVWFDEASPTTETDDSLSTIYVTGTVTDTTATNWYTVTSVATAEISPSPTSYYYSFDYQSLTKGTIIGIAVGSAVGGLVVGSLLIWFLVRKVLGRRGREEASKGRTSTSTSRGDGDGNEGAGGTSAKGEAAQHVKPVYDMDDSTMRGQMRGTVTRRGVEGAQKEETDADRYRRFMGL